MSEQNNKPATIKVVVAKDKLKAWIKIPGLETEDFTPPNATDIVRYLEATRIPLTDELKKRVEQIVAQLQSGPHRNDDGKLIDTFLAAEGTPPTEAQDGWFDWAPDLAERFAKPDDDAAQVDYFSLNTIVTVSSGTCIGKVVAPVDGVPGADVYGQKILPARMKGSAISFGPGVQLDQDGVNVVATHDGRVADEHGKIRLYETLEIPGDVDFDSGSVDAVVDVTVHGTIRANFHVHTSGNLTVNKLVEAADIDVGGDMSVRGGVFGHDGHGQVKVAGSLTVNFINEIKVNVGTDLQFEKEILNSTVHVHGHLRGERGTIIGGGIYAREGIEARVLGSEACVMTPVATGISVHALRRARQMEAEVKDLNKSAEQVRQALGPLMANLKRLLPEQRERVTEMMCKADEVETQMNDLEQERERILTDAAPKGVPYVLVNEVAYPGTTITIGTRQHQVKRPLHGPVKIELRKIKNATEMAAVNQRTGSVTPLPSTEISLEELPDPAEAQGNQPDESEQPVADNQYT